MTLSAVAAATASRYPREETLVARWVPMTSDTVAARLRHWRRDRRLTQNELAEGADMTKAYVGKMESGVIKEPGMDVLKRLAEALRIATRELSEPLGIMPIGEDATDPSRWVAGMRGDPTINERTKEIIEQVVELGRTRT